MDWRIAVELVAGAALLIAGAEALVRGASGLAATLGVAPLVIGLTVVAAGTSSPELAVTGLAAFRGEGDIAVGSVVGSNLLNTFLILGLSAVVAPLIVKRQLIRLDVPLMIAASGGTWLLARDGALGRLDGALLLLVLIAYTVVLIRIGRHDPGAEAEVEPATVGLWGRWPVQLALIAAGLALLYAGSQMLVAGAVAVAHHLGISELVIGLTVVAIGTSLPEVATSVMATIRGQRDLAVGNVIGSNLFNLLGVLGACGLVAPEPVTVPQQVIRGDLLLVLGSAVACWPVFWTHSRIERWQGALFLGAYLLYVVWLLLSASGHPGLPAFRIAAFGLAVPAGVVALGISVFEHALVPAEPAPPA